MKHTRILPAKLRSATQAGLLLIALLSAGAVGFGATITVTTVNDNGPGSLRQAVADAVDGDTINFSSSLNGQTIALTTGEVLVNKSITISGPGANTLAVDGSHASVLHCRGQRRYHIRADYLQWQTHQRIWRRYLQ